MRCFYKIALFLNIAVLVSCTQDSYAQYSSSSEEVDIKWKEGYLDIHFMHTGGGNTSFIVFPDGTTLLFDAGESIKGGSTPSFPPFTNPEICVGQRIADYIKYFAPRGVIDYALISHYHSDHYGSVKDNTPMATNGVYKLSGITAVGDIIPIKRLLDRNYPRFNYPRDLVAQNNPTLNNYIAFIQHQKTVNGMTAEMLAVGSNSQIKTLYEEYSDFEVRNVKVGQYLWIGKGNQAAEYPFNPPVVNSAVLENGNPLSCAILIKYGKFDYLNCGDIAGVDKFPDFDIETPVANIVGEVDALTLNHHGYKDATSPYFIQRTNPTVIAHQAIHEPHFADKTLTTLSKSKAHVFTMCMPDKVKNWYKRLISNNYVHTRGNFFIRVYDNGERFKVICLDPNEYTPTFYTEFDNYNSK